MSPLSKWLHVSLVRAITCPLCQSAHQVVPFVVRVSTNFLPLFPFFSPLLPLPYHYVLLCTTFLSLIPSCFFLLKSLLLSLPLPPLSSPLSLHPPCVVLFPLPPLPDTLLSLSLLFSARLLSLYFIFLFCIIILLPFSPLLGFYLSIFFLIILLPFSAWTSYFHCGLPSTHFIDKNYFLWCYNDFWKYFLTAGSSFHGTSATQTINRLPPFCSVLCFFHMVGKVKSAKYDKHTGIKGRHAQTCLNDHCIWMIINSSLVRRF